MHTIHTLQEIKSHTDENTIPNGLIEISKGLPIDAFISKIGKYIQEDFYQTTVSNEPKIHVDGENHSLTLHIDKYPHFGVLQLIQYVLAGKYTFFLHQGMKEKGTFWLLIVENNTLVDFTKSEEDWFYDNFLQHEGRFDGFKELNEREKRKGPSKKIERSEDDGKIHPMFTEYNRKHSMNGFPIWGVVVILLLFAGIGMGLYYKLAMTRYDKLIWKNNFSFLELTPDKIAPSDLQKYVGVLEEIPAGSFIMGSKEGENTQPVHEVTLQAFKMGATEVTFEQWDACVADGACTLKPDDEGWGRGQQPVVNISQRDIIDQFLPWLYQKTGYKFELPSESQWEYAARGGTTTLYSFGDTLLCSEAYFGIHPNHKIYNRSDYCCKADGRAAKVKRYSPNNYGLYDMHGNVAELVADQYKSNYLDAPVDGSVGIDLAKGEVDLGLYNNVEVPVRGGGFSDPKQALQVATRHRQSDSHAFRNVGFRLVLNQE